LTSLTKTVTEGENDDYESDSDASNYLLRSVDANGNFDIKKEMDVTVFDDIIAAFINSRYMAPLVALFGIFLAYHITIAPYQTHVDSTNSPMTMDELALIRPVLSETELFSIQHITLRAETEFRLPDPSSDLIKIRFFSSINPHIDYGNRRLPDMFYKGVTFGITTENSHDIPYTGQSTSSLSELYYDLNSMFPKPTAIMERTSLLNTTGWHEAGYGVYFSYADLEKQGKLSNDHRKEGKWARVSEDMMWIARKYRQVYITVWFPHQFGVFPEDKDTKDEDDEGLGEYKYHTIIQKTLPTRTGLFELSSTGVVWLSALNRSSEVGPPPKVIRREWNEGDDDWDGVRN